MSSPYAAVSTSIPVTVISRGPLPADPAAAVLRLEPALHEHERGTECIACAARSDIRALLFDLLQRSRTEGLPLSRVIVDATGLRDPQPVIERMSPASPALGLRDRTVARSFHLVGVA